MFKKQTLTKIIVYYTIIKELDEKGERFMALLVRDMLSLPVAQTFRLVAGEGGLNNQVRYVNLLDFE